MEIEFELVGQVLRELCCKGAHLLVDTVAVSLTHDGPRFLGISLRLHPVVKRLLAPGHVTLGMLVVLNLHLDMTRESKELAQDPQDRFYQILGNSMPVYCGGSTIVVCRRAHSLLLVGRLIGGCTYKERSHVLRRQMPSFAARGYQSHVDLQVVKATASGQAVLCFREA